MMIDVNGWQHSDYDLPQVPVSVMSFRHLTTSNEVNGNTATTTITIRCGDAAAGMVFCHVVSLILQADDLIFSN